MEERRCLQRKYNKALVKARNEGWKRFSSGIGSLSEASRLACKRCSCTVAREQGLLVYGYADDVDIIARGKFLNVLRDRLKYSLRTLEEWCGETKLSINPEKTSTMIFTRKYKVVTPEPLRFGGAEIAYATSVRYPGIQLDPKLQWNEHIKSQIGKTYASLWACRRAMGRNWGFSPKISMWLYKMVLLPRLTYAALVWWPRAEKVEIRNRRKALQGNFLRAAPEALRMTPIDALEVALDLPPRDLLVHWYTNGSRYKDRLDAGLYEAAEQYKSSWSLGVIATVFQVEVLAIKKYVELLEDRQTMNKYIYIWSDSQATIKVLMKPSADSKLVWETMEVRERLGRHNRVTLAWVPGHKDIHGNEVADGLAKQGSLSETEAEPVGVPVAMGNRAIRDKLRREQTNRWRNTKACRKARVIMTH
ncbi:uncharacterized protein LOC107045838 [Diachasma alloeum]|uniref:uncharacterized protein LOC107045838 n=1 Tax=Diachasma alloeum TaxID=454923 RepID=UPI0007382FDA|nr:uncharacterized protein LOC107045838 [Diachasma alloeum]